ncbi:MAG TPA: hypothetical protein PKC43_12815 [Phycisphaerales bacterium]|mgnify:CR=1 FL=1|nr:hypothetical protein [Phycisphaerales bacterium]HMP38315.1 hypothetical protein [Phycisphaerales bacterium]
METPSHAALKRLARAFLLRIGCSCAACEVTCPIARHRVDAAGYADDTVALPAVGERAAATLWSLAAALAGGGQGRGEAPARATSRRRAADREPTTVIVECKRSRSDFFRDGEDVDALLAERQRLRNRRAEIEERQIRQLEPHLRQGGTALFPELETWNFAASRNPAYLRVRRSLAALDRRLYGHAKFSRMVRWRLADHMLILAPAGLLRACELPEGWGLLEVPRRWIGAATRGADRAGALDDLPIRLTIAPPPLDAKLLRRQRLLRNIAVALSAQATREAAALRDPAESER